MWLECTPFGIPGQPAAQQLPPGDRSRKGQAHAEARNRLILAQNLPWWRLPTNSPAPGAPAGLSDAVWQGLGLVEAGATGNPKELYGDPLQAINGLLTTMRRFLEADIATVRSKGIGLAPAPLKLVDPHMENVAEYNVEEWAIRFAMTMAPALTADVHTDSRCVQFCIPVLKAPGLDQLGGTVAETGELMLRAFILLVNCLQDVEVLLPAAVTHKAETVEVQGHLWFTKACASDREAVALVNQDMATRRAKRVYAYLGGGGLTEASTELASGVVVKTKTWELGAAVVAATTLLSAAVPGRTVRLERRFVTTDFQPDEEADDVPSTSADAADDFVGFCDMTWDALSLRLGLAVPADPPSGAHYKSPDEAWATFQKMRHLLEV